jgi:hypothetical protein
MKKSKAGRGKSVAKRKAANPRPKAVQRASRSVARTKAVRKGAAKKTVRRKAPAKPRPKRVAPEPKALPVAAAVEPSATAPAPDGGAAVSPQADTPPGTPAT